MPLAFGHRNPEALTVGLQATRMVEPAPGPVQTRGCDIPDVPLTRRQPRSDHPGSGLLITFEAGRDIVVTVDNPQALSVSVDILAIPLQGGQGNDLKSCGQHCRLARSEYQALARGRLTFHGNSGAQEHWA